MCIYAFTLTIIKCLVMLFVITAAVFDLVHEEIQYLAHTARFWPKYWFVAYFLASSKKWF